jgi:cytochrome c-type biogenesis protein CcmH/NrfG
MHDAQKTVSLDASNVKGWSRLAKAHLQMLHPDETKDAISHGLALDAKNKDLLRIQVRLVLPSARSYGIHINELTRQVGSRAQERLDELLTPLL